MVQHFLPGVTPIALEGQCHDGDLQYIFDQTGHHCPDVEFVDIFIIPTGALITTSWWRSDWIIITSWNNWIMTTACKPWPQSFISRWRVRCGELYVRNKHRTVFLLSFYVLFKCCYIKCRMNTKTPSGSIAGGCTRWYGTDHRVVMPPMCGVRSPPPVYISGFILHSTRPKSRRMWNEHGNVHSGRVFDRWVVRSAQTHRLGMKQATDCPTRAPGMSNTRP